MISNAGVYRDHQFIYQDYIYDDHGPNTDSLNRRDLPFGAWPDPSRPTDPRFSPTGGSVRYAGDFTYGSSGGHIANVADLIEFRVTADAAFVYYRIRFGDMTAVNSNVVGICANTDLNSTTGVHTWPLGANLKDRVGCDHFITAYGDGAIIHLKQTSRELQGLGGAVRADVTQAIMEIAVPTSIARPNGGTWRFTVGAGLWDVANRNWWHVAPLPSNHNAPLPTGGHPLAPNVFDLLSNNGEPNSYWMEEKQANDLVQHRTGDNFIDVSFARLADAADDPDPRPTGFVPRIYKSAHPMSPARGLRIDGSNFVYNGPYQPYAMVVPSNYYDNPSKSFAFDLCMHPLNGNHMVEIYYAEAFARDNYNPLVTGTLAQTGYLGFTQMEGLINRLGTLYACVLGRGEGVGYTGGNGLVDVLEVQRDVEAHYRVDQERVTVHGVSLGAIGTWYMSQLYPDRFAAAMPYIFSPAIGVSNPLLGNLHNLPVYYAIGTLDQFGQGPLGEIVADQMIAHGNEFVFLHYLGRQHEGRIEQDFLPFTEALAYTKKRVTNPARVKYMFDPARFNAKEPGDGSAYWVRNIVRRTNSGTASVDAISLARADQLPRHQLVVEGLYTNAAKGWQGRFRGLFRMTEAQFREIWSPRSWENGWEELNLRLTQTTLPVPARANGFTMKTSNTGSLTLDAQRMGLDTSTRITATLTGDGPTTLTLLGDFASGRTVTLNGVVVSADATSASLTAQLDLNGDGEHALVVE